ncbi:MAG: energy transducer TonB, partial [Candidatus Neomarinimicrobiota bacterium]
EAMLRNVRYPPHLEDAGIEGNVVVQAFVDKTGKVIYVKILKGVPEIELNEAALDAIKKTRFRPAKQRDIPVGVWISLPVTFRIGL